MKRAFGILLVTLIVVSLIGCGGGGSAGGSGNIPTPKGTAVLDYYVYAPQSRSVSLLVSKISEPPTGYAPVVGALVEAVSDGQTFTAQTDAKGHFVLSGLPNKVAKVSIKPTISSIASWVGDLWPSTVNSSSAGVEVLIRKIDASRYPLLHMAFTVFNFNTGTYEQVNNSQVKIQISDRPVVITGSGVTTPDAGGPDLVDMYFHENTSMTGHAKQIDIQVFASQGNGRTFGEFKPMLRLPLENPALYSSGSYGGRSFYYDNIHLGEDIKLDEGTPILAIGDGRVVQYEAHQGYGELVCVIEHNLGKNYHLNFQYLSPKQVDVQYICSIYGHIRNCQTRGGTPLPLKVGDYVQAGDVIGYINDDAHNGDGPEHLHLGIRLGAHPGHWAYYGYENASIPESNVSNFVPLSELMELIQ